MTTTTLPDTFSGAASRLDGKVAIVTGANGASGAPVARALSAAGADLVLVHRGNDPDAVDALAGDLPGDGRVAAVVADTSTPDGVAAAFTEAIDRMGSADIAVHLPGLLTAGPLAGVDDASWRAHGAANLDSAFYVLREAARRMADDGRVILLSTSLTGVTVPGYGAYTPYKAAVEHLVRTGAKELGARGITVNAIAPGPLDSPMVNDAMDDEALAQLRAFSPMGRLGTWEDVAPAIAFLASPAARWVSAQTLRVNGAMTA